MAQDTKKNLTERAEKIGILGGTLGGIVGGTLWLIILGIVIKSPLIIVMPIVCGAICFGGVLKLYQFNPARKFAILGLAFLWIIVLNFILANIVYHQIPDMIGGVSTGKGQFSLTNLNFFLGGMSIMGFGFVIRDLLETHS